MEKLLQYMYEPDYDEQFPVTRGMIERALCGMDIDETINTAVEAGFIRLDGDAYSLTPEGLREAIAIHNEAEDARIREHNTKVYAETLMWVVLYNPGVTDTQLHAKMKELDPAYDYYEVRKWLPGWGVVYLGFRWWHVMYLNNLLMNYDV